MSAATSEAILAGFVDRAPQFAVTDAEFHRLLGYPAGREWSERARELAEGARAWYAQHGRPWLAARELTVSWDTHSSHALLLDGVMFQSERLRRHWARHHVERAVAVVVGAGANCESEARTLWEEGKPDEYFFLETLGSAVVEALIATANGSLCSAAEREGWTAVPHYSPGFAGWNVADQVPLFAIVAGGAAAPSWPEPVEVLSSGMLKPKKSQLTLIGLRRHASGEAAAPMASPCAACSLADCSYRRRPFRRLPVRTSDLVGSDA